MHTPVQRRRRQIIYKKGHLRRESRALLLLRKNPARHRAICQVGDSRSSQSTRIRSPSPVALCVHRLYHPHRHHRPKTANDSVFKHPRRHSCHPRASVPLPKGTHAKDVPRGRCHGVHTLDFLRHRVGSVPALLGDSCGSGEDFGVVTW